MKNYQPPLDMENGKVIVDKYLQPGARQELNIRSYTKKNLTATFRKSESIPQTFFEQVSMEIEALLNADLCAQFLQSPEFHS